MESSQPEQPAGPRKDTLSPLVPPEFPVRLGRRLTLVLAAIVVAMLFAGGISLLIGMRISQINRATDREYIHALATDELYVTFQQIISEIQYIQATEKFDRIERIRGLQQGLAKNLRAFVDFHRQEAASVDETMEQPLVDSLSRLEADLRVLSDRAMMKFVQGTFLDVAELDQLQDMLDRGEQTAQDLRHFHRERMVRMYKEDQSYVRLIVMLYMGLLVIGGVLIGLASLTLHRNIAAPLVRVAGAANKIAEGRLEERVPVIHRDEIGQLSHAFNVMADCLQERERDLLAAQARLEKKVHEIQSLIQGGAEILRLHDLDAVLRSVVERARDLLGSDAAVIFLETHTGGEMVLRAMSGPPEAFRPMDGTFRADDTCVVSQRDCLGKCPVVCPEYARAHLSRPLLRGSDPIGVLCVSSCEERSFGASEAETLYALALQASMAIENARLYDEIRGLAANEERRRIAQDMHDGLAQTVGLLHLKVGQAQSFAASSDAARIAEVLAEMAVIAENACDEVRQSIYGLRIMVSRGLGLVPKLTEFLQDFSARFGIPVELEAPDQLPLRLQPATETQVVRIIQEALANVRKHAQASRAWVRLQNHDDRLRVIIEDDGRGWHPADVPAPGSQHLGLAIMRERAESLRGTLEVETAPGQGTRVTVLLPLEGHA